MKISQQKISSIVIMFLTVATAIVYFNYLYKSKSLVDILISLIPTIVFTIGGILVFGRDQEQIKKTKDKTDSKISIELNWYQALKHDLLTYFLPVLIIILPFFFKQVPTLKDVLAAVTVFLVLSYLKIMYWGQL
ncbi:MAG: hypothetical protein WC675_00700 [Patescibacteria group bacterium]|jgi:hypothetical protein